jgi:hypothetical protein
MSREKGAERTLNDPAVSVLMMNYSRLLLPTLTKLPLKG